MHFALLKTLALAAIVVAKPALELAIAGPSEVTDVSNLKVVTSLKNVGDEDLKLLNDPRGALNSFPTKTFAIQHASGAMPEFTGAMLKYVPSTVVSRNRPDSFTILKPGESVSIEHDLASTYDFTSSGAGSYTFLPSNLFHYVSGDKAVPIYATHAAAGHTSEISGRLSFPRATTTASLAKRASYVGCSSNFQSQLVSAASAAQNYAAAAFQYTSSHTSSTSRFTTWFGTYSSSHHSTVNSHYSNLNSGSYASYTYDCSTCDEPDTYAYTYPDQYGVVYLCDVFWESPTTGTDSQGGTLIHESTHFNANAGTQDYAYGQSACKSLAKSNSAEAIENADSHEYFAENNPALS